MKSVIALFVFLSVSISQGSDLGKLFTESSYAKEDPLNPPIVERKPSGIEQLEFYEVKYRLYPRQMTTITVIKKTGLIFSITESGKYRSVNEAIFSAARICEGLVKLPEWAGSDGFVLENRPGKRFAGTNCKITLNQEPGPEGFYVLSVTWDGAM